MMEENYWTVNPFRNYLFPFILLKKQGNIGDKNKFWSPVFKLISHTQNIIMLTKYAC